MKQIAEESFLKDVAKHEMTVLLDNGIYRHLRFKKPTSSDMYFDVVTWPGYLAYSGDMGSFVFSRLDDMFQFFRKGSKENGLYVNLSYWGEKLEAVDRNGRESGHRVYSSDKMRERVDEHVKHWVEEFDGTDTARNEFEVELRYAVEEDVDRYLDDSEHEARKAVADFSVTINDEKYEFSDTWEWCCEEYTFRYVWCCYALAWSIRQYDELKAAA